MFRACSLLKAIRKPDTLISRRALAPVLLDEPDASAFRLMVTGPLLVLLVCMALTWTAQPALAQRVDDTWLGSLNEGRRAATQTGKPLFVVFRCVR